MNLLITLNSDVTIQDNIQATVLHYLCASRADTDVIRYCLKKILENGADVNALDIQQQSPLLFAAKNHSATVMKELIEAGATINQANDQKITPLMLAVQGGTLSKVTLLIEHGALVNERDAWGKTPLMYLPKCTKRLLQVAQRIIEAGADVNIHDNNENTILSHILLIDNADNRRQKFLKLFLKHGASVEQKHYSIET